MVATTSIALLLSLSVGSYAMAIPELGAPRAEAIHKRSSYSIPAVRNVNYVRNGAAAMKKAYNKYNLKPTGGLAGSFLESLPENIVKRQDGSAVATPATGDVEYLVPVSIGGETLNLDFDTGSSDLWVFSSLLPTADQSGHSIYTSSSSSDFKSLSGATWDISYADGSGSSGVVGTDTVVIGGTTVTGQAVELAKKVSASFVSGAGDGLVGFAFSSINTVSPTPQKTFFENAISGLSQPYLGAFLPANADGAYDFGAPDSSNYDGEITFVNVDNSNGFWEFPSTSFKVGSAEASTDAQTGIADTGTTLILMTDDAVEAYYKQVSGASLDSTQGGYVFDCDATLPTLSLAIGDNYATIPAALLNFGATTSGGSTCFGTLQSVGSGTQNIYGDGFFNAYYGVFDLGTPAFGFATSTGAGASTSS